MATSKLFIPAFIALAAVAAGAYFGFKSSSSSDSTPPAPTVPVTTAYARQDNMPVRVRSIGSVVSLHSVEVRTQVDGILIAQDVKEGQTVKQGDLVARIDDRSIRAVLVQQRAELANRQAQLDVALLDLKRYEELQAQKAISGQILDQQKALVQQLRQALQTQKAVIDEQEVMLSYTRIQSPITGMVGILNTHQGNYVRAGDTQSLFSIVQIDPIGVEIALPQNLLSQLLPLTRTNSLTSIPVTAYDSTGQQLLAQGHLSLIDNRVATATGTIRVRAEFENGNRALWPGQTVLTSIQLRQIENAIVIPQTAIRQGNRYTYVWQIRDDHAAPVTVEVVHTDENLVAVTGLEVGAEVVTDGASRLQEGALVRRTNAEEPAVVPDNEPPPVSADPDPVAESSPPVQAEPDRL